jgi:propionyl-CoA synthetase
MDCRWLEKAHHRQLLANRNRLAHPDSRQRCAKNASKYGSPGIPMYGFDVKLVDENTGEPLHGADQKGVVVIEGPLPPGCLQTLWGDDERFVKTYWQSIPGKLMYSTFDWGVRDEDGYYFILGRTDDVINVAGHRLGTREIEESISSHPNVAEVAVVGVADQLKGQVAMAFVVAKDTSALGDAAGRLKLEGEIMKLVDSQLGAVARPSRVLFLSLLPKTRSGKLLRRAIQAVCEKRDPGDLTTIDDPRLCNRSKNNWLDDFKQLESDNYLNVCRETVSLRWHNAAHIKGRTPWSHPPVGSAVSWRVLQPS